MRTQNSIETIQENPYKPVYTKRAVFQYVTTGPYGTKDVVNLHPECLDDYKQTRIHPRVNTTYGELNVFVQGTQIQSALVVCQSCKKVCDPKRAKEINEEKTAKMQMVALSHKHWTPTLKQTCQFIEENEMRNFRKPAMQRPVKIRAITREDGRIFFNLIVNGKIERTMTREQVINLARKNYGMMEEDLVPNHRGFVEWRADEITPAASMKSALDLFLSPTAVEEDEFEEEDDLGLDEEVDENEDEEDFEDGDWDEDEEEGLDEDESEDEEDWPEDEDEDDWDEEEDPDEEDLDEDEDEDEEDEF